jgi:hypothetical protein
MARFATPYELNEIYGTLTDREYPTPTELQSNFGIMQPFETETINLDKVSPDLRIGIFVAPDAQAKPTVARGYQTKVFYPAYWKDKTTVDFRNIRARRVGEQISVPTSNAGRIAAALQDNMMIMQAKRDRLLEWIASQILLYGSYVATSERHPSVLVDLEPNIATDAATLNGGRANRANLTATAVNLPTGSTLPVITDNGGAGKRAWGSTGGTKAVSPIADLQQMLDASWEPISKIYMSDDAWLEVTKDASFATVISTLITTTSSFLVDLLPKQQSKEGLKLRGTIAGIPIWTYNAAYQGTASSASTLTKFIPNGWVVMVPAANYGVQAYGAIQHGAADFVASELFFNSWVEDEFGTPWLQAQSCPLFLHTKINSTVAWKVM